MTPESTKPRKERKRRFLFMKAAGVVLLVLAVALWIVVRFVAPPMIVEPTRTGTDVETPGDFTHRTYRSDDQVSLSAWQNHPKATPIAVILILHGIADSKASQAGTLRSLADRGIAAIAPDLRAHGQSGGLASYGFHERRDISIMIDACKTEFPGIPIGIWGTSYGAAVALQSITGDSPLDFAIIESTFADLSDMARQQVSNHASPLLGWLAPLALSRAGELAAFDPTQVSPERSIRTARIPVLHFHGTMDEVIPFEHGRRISRQVESTDYRFVPIHGGGHYNLQQTDPETYRLEVDKFLAKVTGSGS